MANQLTKNWRRTRVKLKHHAHDLHLSLHAVHGAHESSISCCVAYKEEDSADYLVHFRLERQPSAWSRMVLMFTLLRLKNNEGGEPKSAIFGDQYIFHVGIETVPYNPWISPKYEKR